VKTASCDDGARPTKVLATAHGVRNGRGRAALTTTIVAAAVAALVTAAGAAPSVRSGADGAQPLSVRLGQRLLGFGEGIGLPQIVPGPSGMVWVPTGTIGNGSLSLFDAGGQRVIVRAGALGAIAPSQSGALLFAAHPSLVERVTSSGRVVHLKVSAKLGDADGIADGPDGGIWLHVGGGTALLSRRGTLLRLATPFGKKATDWLGGSPQGAWVAGNDDRVALIGTDGTTLWTSSDPLPLRCPQQTCWHSMATVGPEGSLWIAAAPYGLSSHDVLVRISPAGIVTTVTTSQAIKGYVTGIALDGAGNVFVATEGPYVINEVAQDGSLQRFPQKRLIAALAVDSTNAIWSVTGRTLTRRLDLAEPLPASAGCVAPSLYGLTAAAAQTAVAATTCKLGIVNGPTSGSVVWGQTPFPGKSVRSGVGIGVLLGVGTVPLTGLWQGVVMTEDACFSDGTIETTSPEPLTLAIAVGADGRLTAGFAGLALGLSETSFHQKDQGGLYFDSPSPKHWLTLSEDVTRSRAVLSFVIHNPGQYNCAELTSYGSMYRTAEP